MSTSPLSVFNSDRTASGIGLPDEIQACWMSPSNIALIKYWGKKMGQLPTNPSLSLSLSEAHTITSIVASRMPGNAELVSINNDNTHPFLSRLNGFFQWMVREIPILNGFSYKMETHNSFPHSTGIASSASGLSAFTFCMLDIAGRIADVTVPEKQFRNIASYASRMGSGSACRSVYGGFSAWGQTDLIPDSSDDYAIDINELVHPDLARLKDAILVISSNPKSVSSSTGHSLMNKHPYAQGRYLQVTKNLEKILDALKTGDLNLLGEISENEALSLHFLIMTSAGGDILITPASLAVMKQIRLMRASGLPVFYTLDAGPNVHLLYPESAAVKVENFIKTDLVQYCENGNVIFDHYGNGPVKNGGSII